MSEPFRFATASELVEITGRRARNLEEMLRFLRESDGASIFHHTYQTLRVHHMLVERYPNDYAQWVHEACGEETLAERLAGIDLREFRSIQALRERFIDVVEEYLKAHPGARTRPARKPFDLCGAILVVTPTGDVARTIDDFREILGSCSIRTIHYHFVTARLRLDLETNDFSAWLATTQGRPDLAERLDRIDFTTQTLEDIRSAMVETLA
ncbi:MAG: DUF5752 family protein [bacterium]